MPHDETQLFEYVLGLLAKDSREAVERMLQEAPEHRAELPTLLDIISQVALSTPPVQPSPQVRQRLLASLEPKTRFEGFLERLVTFFDLSVAQVRTLLDKVEQAPASPWEASGVPGTSLLHLIGGPRVAAADCGLVFIEPGHGFPLHRHLGDEWAIVLQGRAQEDSGHISAPGDLVHNLEGSSHTFRVLGDEPFVFAVVVYEGIEIDRAALKQP